jgi:predicted nucleotidyltransferase
MPHPQDVLPKRLSRALGDDAGRLRGRVGTRVRGLRPFGSWARGEANPSSDVDVWVLVDVLDAESRNDPFEAAEETLLEHGVDLMPTVMDLSEWESLLGRERRIALDIEREGLPF